MPGQDTPTFSTGVKLVNLLATVRTKKGEIVRDLNKDDFLLLEKGRPQAIRYFARESDLPLTLGLLVDTSMSQRRVINVERGACSVFLDQVLRDRADRVFIVQFDMEVHISQGLTSSRRELDEALAFVDTPTVHQLQNQRGGGTLLYDAIETASKFVMKNQSGRKALVVLSDGGENGSDATMAVAVEAAQRTDTLVYSIVFADSRYGSEDRGVLQRISSQTGGGFFEVSKKQSLERIFDILQEELRSQYSLGCVSDEPVQYAEFRKIELLTKRKDLIVQARNGYWTGR